LVAYSTPRGAYEQLTSDFAETEAGRGVTFETSYGASGEQSRAVEGGLPADVVAFSLEPDITRLVKAGLVDSNWNKDDYKGMVTDSVVVLAVRSGNPKGIRSWDDLTTEGIEVITPNPFTSGGLVGM
jgi:sulfate transport system substrate-binding protein